MLVAQSQDGCKRLFDVIEAELRELKTLRES
jgi:hypothetical protein